MIGQRRLSKKRVFRCLAQVLGGLTACSVLASVALSSALAADELAGKALALQWCASCHLVAEDQPSAASTSLPSFYDMAADPLWSEDKLATFLVDPHPRMPGMSLKTIEIANLAKYIRSLKP